MHQQNLKFGDVVDDKLAEAIGKHVTGLRKHQGLNEARVCTKARTIQRTAAVTHNNYMPW